MNTHQIGNIVELEVMLAFTRLGYSVSTPYGNSNRYDLVVDIDGQLLRIQCKKSTEECDGDAFRFDTRNTHYYKGTTRHVYYDATEIDYFATINRGKCYLIPVSECHRGMRLRHRISTLQNKNINWAADYELEKVIARIKEGQIESSDTN